MSFQRHRCELANCLRVSTSPCWVGIFTNLASDLSSPKDAIYDPSFGFFIYKLIQAGRFDEAWAQHVNPDPSGLEIEDPIACEGTYSCQRLSYCILDKVRELVDRNDVQIKHFKSHLARFNHGFCLLNAGCVEDREEARFVSYFV